MKIEILPIEQVRPYEKNAKKHPESQIKKLAESIEEFGFNARWEAYTGNKAKKL